MSNCPYTWFVGLFSKSEPKPGQLATFLRVTVEKNNDRVVDVALPAQSARWLIDLIPYDVVAKIREEGVPLDEIQNELSQRKELHQQKIFTLKEPHRVVDVWLE
jgi:hypothetical protein